MLVVGAGPSGLVFALLSAKLGKKSIVLERREHPSIIPRAIHLDRKTLYILKLIGVDQFKTEPLTQVDYKGDKGSIVALHEKDLKALNEYRGSVWFRQYELERELWKLAEEEPNIQFLKNTTVDKVSYDKDTFVLVCDDQVFLSKTLIAADGANSIVRNNLNVNLEQNKFSQEWEVVDFTCRHHEKFPKEHIQYCSAQFPFTYIKGPDSEFRIEFQTTKEDADLNMRANLLKTINNYLLKGHPYDSPITFSDIEIIRNSKYTFNSTLLKKNTIPNCYFIGDAYHLLPPFAGKGLCLGIKDAYNLSWKICCCKSPKEINYYEERDFFIKKDIQISTLLGRVVTKPPALLFYISKLIKPLLYITNYTYLLERCKYHLGPNYRFLNGYYYADIVDESIINPENDDYGFKLLLDDNNRSLGEVGKDNGLKVLYQKNFRQSYLGHLFLKYDFILLRPDNYVYYAGTKTELVDTIYKMKKYYNRRAS